MQTHTTLPPYTKLDFKKPSSSDTFTQAHSAADMFRMLIETEVLEEIDRLLDSNALDSERAGEIAEHTLSIIQEEESIDEHYKAVQKLDSGFPELRIVVKRIGEVYAKVFDEPTVEHASKLVKAGQFDLAQDVIKSILKAKSSQRGNHSLGKKA